MSRGVNSFWGSWWSLKQLPQKYILLAYTKHLGIKPIHPFLLLFWSFSSQLFNFELFTITELWYYADSCSKYYCMPAVQKPWLTLKGEKSCSHFPHVTEIRRWQIMGRMFRCRIGQNKENEGRHGTNPWPTQSYLSRIETSPPRNRRRHDHGLALQAKGHGKNG